MIKDLKDCTVANRAFTEGMPMTGASFLPAGAMVALATPVRADGALDEGGLERLVQRVVSGGVDGICPLGSTGEGARFSRAQRREITRRVRALAPAGMPVIPGLPLVTPGEAPAELEGLAEAGATAVLMAPPSYYPLSDDGVLRMYESVADRSPIPLLLYNIPVYTKVTIAPRVVGLLATHPSIAGIKDSNRNMEYQAQVIQATRDAEFRVLTGADTLLVVGLTLGAAGIIGASANLVPELTTGVYRAFGAGDVPGALCLQERLTRITNACRAGFPPAGWKAALEIAGVCEAHLVPPGTGLSAGERASLTELLTAEGLAAGQVTAAGAGSGTSTGTRAGTRTGTSTGTSG
jgi:4-hydroxy-tetrahydrodipicolinate synthase